MTKNEYMGLINVEFPDIYNIVSMNVVCPTMVNVVECVGKELFVKGVCDSPLANETRKQMVSMKIDGVLSFDK